MVGKYKVITLCGSTRFKDEFMEVQKRLTLEGNIVISVGLFGHSGDNEVWENMDEGSVTRTKEMLDDILEYYRKEFPRIRANASQIPWQLDDDSREMLPVMQTDIMLTCGDRTLIIDAKYYEHSTQIQYGKHTLHSGNLYQIFTYVKNKELELAEKPHEVSGLLLYARTDEDIYPENEYRMSGNRIAVRTLNLDVDFSEIRVQLDEIALRYLGVEAA